MICDRCKENPSSVFGTGPSGTKNLCIVCSVETSVDVPDPITELEEMVGIEPDDIKNPWF